MNHWAKSNVSPVIIDIEGQSLIWVESGLIRRTATGKK